MAEQSDVPRYFRKNLLNTLWIQAPSLLIGFLLSILLNRLLGPEGKGMYSIFDSTARFLTTLFGFNLGAAIIYFSNTGEVRRGPLLRFIHYVVVVTFGLSTLAASLLYLWNPRFIFFPAAMEAPVYGLYYLLWVGLAVGEYLFRSLLHAQKRIDRANNVMLLMKGLRFAAVALFLILLGGKPKADLVAWVLGLNVVIILLGLLLQAWYAAAERDGSEGGEPVTRQWAIRLFRYSAFLQLGAVLQFLNYKFDHWVILYYLDNTQLGWYSAANDLAQMIWLPSNVGLLLLFPYLSDRALEDGTKRKMFLTMARAVSTITLLAIAFVVLFSELLVVMLYGSPFASSAGSLRILIIGMGLLNYARIHTVWLTSTDSTRYVFYATLVAFGCTLLFDLLLIPPLGIIGAALATTLAFAAMTVYQLHLSRTKFGIPLGQTWLLTRADVKEIRMLLASNT